MDIKTICCAEIIPGTKYDLYAARRSIFGNPLVSFEAVGIKLGLVALLLHRAAEAQHVSVVIGDLEGS